MSVVRFAHGVLLAGLIGLTGCTAFQPVPLYQLDSGNPRVPEQKTGPAVLLGPVEVADYLNCDLLLQRQADGSLTAARRARWAGNLPNDIDQLLLRQLAGRLDSQRLAMAPAAPGFTPEVQVQLSITRLDSGPKQPAVLEAQWRLLDKRGQLRDTRLVRLEEPHQGAPADQVKAQSLVLQRLAEQLASAIQPLAAAEAEAAAAEEARKNAATRTPKKVEPAKPQIPIPSPVRQDVEIYRF
ncbi:hypothetical protein BZL41_14885 [Pseudomonas sp. PIC25]|uniref:PqiC family protein n=1 Tax=Pseudomonas sp. PIC25 TaxID=1958773 RepID=UPI000BAB4A94|nr:ABC-type transport auxiliary lipoprotein family protein [Pseudomonas sp. PIC25]PAU60782.1 hypothetical protein BZL41_14885 [Pseudomonas sp. PIC25]